VFKAHRLVYDSILGLGVIKKKTRHFSRFLPVGRRELDPCLFLFAQSSLFRRQVAVCFALAATQLFAAVREVASSLFI